MKILELHGDKTPYVIINRIVDEGAEASAERIYEVLPIKKLDFTNDDIEVIGITPERARERELDSVALRIHEFRCIIDGDIVKTMRSYHIVPAVVEKI